LPLYTIGCSTTLVPILQCTPSLRNTVKSKVSVQAEMKELNLYCIRLPEPMNIYGGVVHNVKDFGPNSPMYAFPPEHCKVKNLCPDRDEGIKFILYQTSRADEYIQGRRT
jgi:hypothetical protein